MPTVYAKFPKYVEPKTGKPYIVQNEEEYKKFLNSQITKKRATRKKAVTNGPK